MKNIHASSFGLSFHRFFLWDISGSHLFSTRACQKLAGLQRITGNSAFHLWELGRELFPQDRKLRRRWVRRRKKQLDEGRTEHLVRFLRSLRPETPELVEKLRTEAAYFEGHADRMRYAEFRRQELFIGSGLIEAGCRGVIAGRLKRSGMFWPVEGANAIIALHCAQISNRFADYWEDRAAA